MVQLIVATVLLFVLFFGLGFILNMLVKTTWLPVYGYFVLLIVWFFTHLDGETAMDSLKSYTYVDYIAAVGGLLGTILGAWTIKTLRDKGYKMF